MAGEPDGPLPEGNAMTLFDPATDATIPLDRAVLCLDCEVIRHAARSGGRCPCCGSDSSMPLMRVTQSASSDTAEEMTAF